MRVHGHADDRDAARRPEVDLRGWWFCVAGALHRRREGTLTMTSVVASRNAFGSLCMPSGQIWCQSTPPTGMTAEGTMHMTPLGPMSVHAARDDAFASAGISLQRCAALDCMQQQFVGLASAANTNSQPPVRTRIKLGHSSSSYTIGASLQKQMPFIFNKLREITINWSDCKWPRIRAVGGKNCRGKPVLSVHFGAAQPSGTGACRAKLRRALDHR